MGSGTWHGADRDHGRRRPGRPERVGAPRRGDRRSRPRVRPGLSLSAPGAAIEPAAEPHGDDPRLLRPVFFSHAAPGYRCDERLQAIPYRDLPRLAAWPIMAGSL